MKRRFAYCAVALLGVWLLAGCATTGAMDSARTAFGKAKAAGAESKAPYEYYSAEAFLQKAEHEVKEGDSSMACEFAQESETFSNRAVQKAGGGVK